MRTRRRAFAAPFVVTVIGGAAALGCSGQIHSNPGPPTRGSADPTVTETGSGSSSGSGSGTDTAVIGPGGGGYTQAPPDKIEGETRWRVTKLEGNAGCSAYVEMSCGRPATPGGQVPTCNPPGPVKYACPENMVTGELVISMMPGAKECFVVPGGYTCPAGAICNPPPPRKVTCPSR